MIIIFIIVYWIQPCTTNNAENDTSNKKISLISKLTVPFFVCAIIYLLFTTEFLNNLISNSCCKPDSVVQQYNNCINDQEIFLDPLYY